jgi:hypothetical protein
MQEEKITGVCVDIPTIIENAKMDRIVDNLIAEKGPQWISVEERLPEENRAVLGWDGIHCYESRLMEQEIIPFDHNRAYEKRILIQDSESGFMVDPILPITHWMPLPEPPKIFNACS